MVEERKNTEPKVSNESTTNFPAVKRAGFRALINSMEIGICKGIGCRYQGEEKAAIPIASL